MIKKNGRLFIVEIKEIKKIKLDPEDVLIVSLPQNEYDTIIFDDLWNHLNELFPNNKKIVKSETCNIFIIKPEKNNA